jgi:hypothetical protein
MASSFAMDRMVLSIKDILCSLDISEKGAEWGYLMDIWMVSDFV